MDTAMNILKHHGHGHNDTTGHLPIPEIPHQHGLEHIGHFGQTTLWVVTAIMGVSTVIFLLAGSRVAAQRSLFHRITALITFCAAVSYWVMATGGGKTVVRAPSGHHERAFREVFYARDIDWLITTPLLLLDLTLLAGVAPLEIVSIVFADIGMIVLGLFAGLAPGLKIRWIPYAGSCLLFLYVVFALLIKGRKTAAAKSDRVGALFTAISLFAMFIWTAYPIVFALAEGTNYLKSDTEVLLYAILDVLAKPVFGFWLLIAQASIDDNDTFLIPDSWTSSQGNYGSLARVGLSRPCLARGRSCVRRNSIRQNHTFCLCSVSVSFTVASVSRQSTSTPSCLRIDVMFLPNEYWKTR